jgi:hypothetical protein
MGKSSDSCSSKDLQGSYQYTLTGSYKAMLPGQVDRTISTQGSLDTGTNTSFQVDSDCSVRFLLPTPEPNSAPLNMRGYIVVGGKEILAFQTEPGAMVAARLTSGAP